MAAEVLFGNTLNLANRIAGVLSACVAILISAAVAKTTVRRDFLTGGLSAATIFISCLSLRYVDGEYLRNPIATLATPLMAAHPEDGIISPHIVGLATGAPTLILVAIGLSSDAHRVLRAGALLGAVLGASLVVLSDSRDALVAFLAGGAVLATSLLVRRGLAFGIGGSFALAVAVSAGWLLRDTPTLAQREDLWRLTARLLADSPWWTGLGYGRLGESLRLVYPDVTNAHNLVVQMAADFGVAGLLSFLLASIYSIRRALIDSRIGMSTFRGFASAFAYLIVAGIAESIIDMTQRFDVGDLTVIAPLYWAVLAMPVLAGGPPKSNDGL